MASDAQQPVLRIPLDRCNMARAARILGHRWTLLILREAFYGVRRFDRLRGDLGIPRTVLSQRLAGLVADGLMQKRPYREGGQRTRYEYRLTPMGADLLPVLVALMQWGDAHLGGGQEPPLVIRHAGCGKTVSAGLVCQCGHRLTRPDEFTARAGVSQGD